METWTVNLLGVPTARCSVESARLPTKETWGVLISLLLPLPLYRPAESAPDTGIVMARETLAHRIWPNHTNPRDNLRPALSALRKTFGPECFLDDRQFVRVVPGAFRVDVLQIKEAYRQAQAANDIEARLTVLAAAEAAIQGQFLEAFYAEKGHNARWMTHYRQAVHRLIVHVLLDYIKALRQADNLTEALQIAQRILPYHWDVAEALKQVEELERATGQKQARYALRAVTRFVDAVSGIADFERQRLAPISEEERTLNHFHDVSLQPMPEDTDASAMDNTATREDSRKREIERNRFLRLSVFPATFSAGLAKEICDVPSTQLRAFCNQEVIQRHGEEYALADAVRHWAWRQLPVATKSRLREDLARFCVDRMTGDTPPENVLPATFISMQQSKPLLQMALQWVLEQPPNYLYAHFINRLRYAGLRDLAPLGLPYLQQIYTAPELLPEWRINAALWAAWILRDVGKYAAANIPLEMILPVVQADSITTPERVYRLIRLAAFHTNLMMNCSDLGEWDKGKKHGQEALKFCREEAQEQGANHCLRILAEIHYRAGDLDAALTLCEEVLALRRRRQFSENDIPDARFWQAQILLGLTRLDEAADAVEEALSHWQDKGDIKVGLCLRLLARLHVEHKRFAEARQLAEYALLRHERAGIEVHRIGSLEAMGDVLAAAGKKTEAKPHYQKCLCYYETQSACYHARRVSEKLAALDYSERPHPD